MFCPGLSPVSVLSPRPLDRANTRHGPLPGLSDTGPPLSVVITQSGGRGGRRRTLSIDFQLFSKRVESAQE